MNKASQLLDSIKQSSRAMDKKIDNDAQLAAALNVDPPVISNIRAGKRKIGAAMIIKIHDLMGWTIRDIKGALDMPCLPLHMPH